MDIFQQHACLQMGTYAGQKPVVDDTRDTTNGLQITFCMDSLP